MKHSLFSLAAATALALPAEPQTSARLKLSVPNGPAVAAELEARGLAVLRPTVAARSLELIALPAERAWLRQRGYECDLIALGRPLKEIMTQPEAIPTGYPDLDRILDDMIAAASGHPAICSMVDLTVEYDTPPTWEGRHIYAVKISDSAHTDEDEPNVLVVCGHHANEIVTPVIGLKAIEHLTSLYGVDPAVTAAVDANEIWIAPTWNPDGYDHVYNHDNWWRKNRRVFPGGIGCDLNRNYENGWSTACAGSTSPTSNQYKGPFPHSEAEVQTMIAWARDRRFAKVLDFHSYSQSIWWGYSCLTHPFDALIQAEAVLLSQACGYGGSNSPTNAEGQHHQWHLGRQGAYAYIAETAAEVQPPYATALAEAVQLQAGLQWAYERPIPLTGRVTDSCSGLPLVATIELVGVSFQNGEVNTSGGRFGRYCVFAPPGDYTVRATAPGYLPMVEQVTITPTGGHALDLSLGGGVTPDFYCTGKVNSQLCLPAITVQGSPGATPPFDIGAVNVLNNKNGMLFYGFAPSNLPFQGGHLCVEPPVRRTPVQLSGGNPPPSDCSGTYSCDFAALIQSGADPLLVAGAHVFAQYWARDPGDFTGHGTSLTNAVAFSICP